MKRTRKRRSNAPPRKVYMPYPELVELGPIRDPWKIEDSNDHEGLPTNGITDKKSRRIFVPLEAGAAEGVTTHELAHVHWSPPKLPRVRHPMIILQAVEDARINLGLERIGLPVTLDREQLAYIGHLAARDAKEGEIASTLIRAIAGLGTAAADILADEVRALPPRAAAFAGRWLERVESRLVRAQEKAGEDVASFRVARSIAKELARDLERHGLLKKDFEVRGLGCCQLVMEPDALDGGYGSTRRSKLDRYIERLTARAGGRERSPGLSVGRMTIDQPPLDVRQRLRLTAGLEDRRCVTEGTRVSRPDRFAIDGAIFVRRTRGKGATVLVDTSGSMSLSPEDVEEIVSSAGGAAFVAIYSGREEEGQLRIVARGEFRASSESFQPFGSGNVVDVPALEWLAKQPEPRLWVSDGCVTGVGDEGCDKILERCLEIARSARIERVENAEQAVEAIEAMYAR